MRPLRASCSINLQYRMVLSQTTHSNELRIQLKEFEEDIATLNLIKAYVSENIFARLFNRTFYFLAEVAFYSFFIIEVMAFVALLYLSDPLSDFLARWISEYIELSVDNIRPIVIFASIIVLLSSRKSVV